MHAGEMGRPYQLMHKPITSSTSPYLMACAGSGVGSGMRSPLSSSSVKGRLHTTDICPPRIPRTACPDTLALQLQSPLLQGNKQQQFGKEREEKFSASMPDGVGRLGRRRRGDTQLPLLGSQSNMPFLLSSSRILVHKQDN